MFSFTSKLYNICCIPCICCCKLCGYISNESQLEAKSSAEETALANNNNNDNDNDTDRESV